MQKIIILLVVACLYTTVINGQNVGIGTTNPDTSAVLDIVTTNKGLLIPRLTSTQRASIFQPKQGLLYYQTDGTTGFYVNRSTIPAIPNWSILTEGENLWTRTIANSNNISPNNSGNLGIGTNNPLSKLNVKSGGYGLLHSDASDNVQVGTYVSPSGGWLGTKSNHNLHFFTNNSIERMTLTTDGTLGLGTTTPNVNAIAEFNSNTKGILLPRVLNVSTMPTAPDGMMAYNTADNFLYIRKAGSWEKVADNTNNAPFSLPYNGSVNTILNALNIQNTNSGFGNAILANASGPGAGVYGQAPLGVGLYGLTTSGTAGRFISDGSGKAATFQTSGSINFTTIGGNVGIGNIDPTFTLDINGRSRLRHNGESAGLWYNKADNTQAAFFGMFNDSIIGLWGNGSVGNWKLGMDAKNARIGIGTMTPTFPLSFATVIGDKISLYKGATGDAGFGVFANELRIHSDNNNADITFGYDITSSGFAEKARIKANGQFLVGINSSSYQSQIRGANARSLAIENSNPHSANTTNTLAFKTGSWYDALIKTITIDASHARLGFFTYASTDDAALVERMSITDGGDVLIGTTDEALGDGYKLRVKGKIISEEIKVQLQAAWPDYVFQTDYSLSSLNDVEKFIQKNNHLPNIPSAADVEKSGIELGEMQRKMMEKIEELTLHLIALNKKIEAQEATILQLKSNK